MNILPTTKSMKPLVLVHFTKCLIFLAGALPMQGIQTSQVADLSKFLITSTKGYENRPKTTHLKFIMPCI